MKLHSSNLQRGEHLRDGFPIRLGVERGAGGGELRGREVVYAGCWGVYEEGCGLRHGSGSGL